MNAIEKYENEVTRNIEKLGAAKEFQAKSIKWTNESAEYKYCYNFKWLGRPIIQYPQDIMGMQEIIWKVKPDLIIETGIAHGGSLIFNASLLSFIDICEAIERGITIDPSKSRRRVLGIDIDIRRHSRAAIEAHPMVSRIEMMEGSSTDPKIISEVNKFALDYECILVCLDSNHTHEHVLSEMEAYAHLVSKGSYCIVFDTIIEDMPDDMFPDRPWGKGNNPKTAVCEYLKSHPEFEIDKSIQNKLLITVASDGYLKRISDS